MAVPVFVLNGPNLNLLGKREPHIYGTTTLADIERDCAAAGKRLGLSIDFRQSNREGELVEWIQQAMDVAKGIVINPAGYSHTSVAIHDAIKGVGLPTIEVHISNIFARESFRHHSYVSPVAVGTICGLGPLGYVLALEALQPLLVSGKPTRSGKKA